MIGYCCINTTLRKNYTVNRTMRKKTFEAKGLSYVGELSLKNISDLQHILKWNLSNDIKLYRMSSDMFPWMSEWNWEDLPQWPQIQSCLQDIGQFVKDNGMRLSFHPGHFNILGSNNPAVVENSIVDLNKHAEIMDIIGLPQDHGSPINIHVRAANPSKEKICKQFCTAFKRLSQSAKSRLTVENDDNKSQYTPKDLHRLIWQEVGVPITFDQFHFLCGTQDQTLQEALELSLSTWGDATPLTHHSSAKRDEAGDPKIKHTAHADYIYEPIQTFGHKFDTDLEAKAKELALFKYWEDFGNDEPS